jgi:F0F1-type ATP synthase delta subunit
MALLSRREVARHAAAKLAQGADRKKLVSLLASYIIERNQQRNVDELIRDIEQYLAKDFNQETLRVTSAYPLSADIKSQLIKEFGSTQHADVVEVVNPNILGGIIVETANKRFDGSVVASIAKLRTIESEV